MGEEAGKRVGGPGGGFAQPVGTLPTTPGAARWVERGFRRRGSKLEARHLTLRAVCHPPALLPFKAVGMHLLPTLRETTSVDIKVKNQSWS